MKSHFLSKHRKTVERNRRKHSAKYKHCKIRCFNLSLKIWPGRDSTWSSKSKWGWLGVLDNNWWCHPRHVTVKSAPCCLHTDCHDSHNPDIQQQSSARCLFSLVATQTATGVPSCKQHHHPQRLFEVTWIIWVTTAFYFPLGWIKIFYWIEIKQCLPQRWKLGADSTGEKADAWKICLPFYFRNHQ